MFYPKRLSCLIFLTVAAAAAAGQTAKPDYSKQAAVVEQNFSQLKFETDGSYTGTDSVRLRVQSEAGVQQFGVLTLPYDSFNCHMDLDYTRVVKPDGSVITTPADNIQDMNTEITRAAPLYSDLREKHVAVKGLAVSDELEYQAKWTCDKPLIPAQFWYGFSFTKDKIVLDERVEISVPSDRKIKLKSSAVKPEITDEGSYRTYKWKSSNLQVKTDEQQKDEQAKTAQQQSRGRLPLADVMMSSFDSWQELGKWYGKLQADRVKPSPEIKAKALELTKDAPDDTAKIHALYNYVSTQFHYIGVDLGIGRYQPHNASDIFENRYGDCKDKHTLLASMLSAVGIEAYPALISSRGELDIDMPSPAQFNHVITVVPQGKNFLWLDTTPEVAPFGLLLAQLREKHALVIPTSTEPMLAITPADPPYAASETFVMEGKLNDSGTLEGKATFTFRGDDREVLFRSAFRRVPIAQWNQLIQGLSYEIGFAGDVTEGTATSPEKLDKPFTISYHYTRKDYPDWANHRITPPLPPLSFYGASESEHAPSYAIWLGSPETSDFESRIELPKNYVPTLLPPLDSKSEFANYHSSSTFEDGVLITKRHIETKSREVPVNKYDAYNKFAKTIIDDHDAYIALAQPTAPESTPRQSSAASAQAPAEEEDSPAVAFRKALFGLPSTTNADARKFGMEAQEAIDQHDLNKAIASLQNAVAADPKFARGWIMLGSFQLMQNHTSTAMDSFHSAISADPTLAGTYKAVALYLTGEKKLDESIPIWQNLIKLTPDDADAYLYLGYAQLRRHSYPDAITAFESAQKLNPGKVKTLAGLGSAYLHNGDDEKAVASFKQALELKPGSEAYNNAAYELAVANKQLPVSLEWAKKAVDIEEQASSKVQLSNLQPDDLLPTVKLGYQWDTLGWVYYRMGDFDNAEKYLIASWQLSGDKVVSDHLREVYAFHHKKTSPALMDVNQMRTVKLPHLAEDNASAEFFILFSRDPASGGPSIQDVKFISGSDSLKSAAKALRAAKYELSFPDDAPTRLLRRGILGCYKYSGCSFVMLSPETVRSVD